jgi:hypothetical protein
MFCFEEISQKEPINHLSEKTSDNRNSTIFNRTRAKKWSKQKPTKVLCGEFLEASRINELERDVFFHFDPQSLQTWDSNTIFGLWNDLESDLIIQFAAEPLSYLLNSNVNNLYNQQTVLKRLTRITSGYRDYRSTK